MSKSVIINDINNASPNVTAHIIPAIRAINKGSNYDDLGNKPIYNINLLEEGFEPIEGEYYRHTGETNNTFTTGVIYYYKESIYNPITGSVKSTSNNFACTGILEKSKWVDKSIAYTEPKSLKYYDVSSYTEEVKCAGIKNNVLYQFNSNGYHKTNLENPDAHEFISWSSTGIENLDGNVDPIMCTTGIYGAYGEALYILCSGNGTSNPVIIMFDVPQYNYVDYIVATELKGNISSIIVLPATNGEESPNVWGIKDNTKLIQFGDTGTPDKFSIDLPERISDSNLCIYNNELYITGGSIKNIYKFNFDTKEITKVCTVPNYFGPSLIDAPCYAIVINNKIYGIDTSNNLVVYDMSGAKIGEVPKILTNEDYSHPIFYCTLISYNNNLYISHCLAQGYNNPVGFVIAELKDVRYEYSIENEGIEENSATSISLNSKYPIIDATKTQGKISLISSNTPDDNKYSVIQVPTQDTNVLEVLNTYKIQKISEVENDKGFVTDKQVPNIVRQFSINNHPDWTERDPNSVGYIKNKDNVNYISSDWTNDNFKVNQIYYFNTAGSGMQDELYAYTLFPGKMIIDNLEKDVLIKQIDEKLNPDSKKNSMYFTKDGSIYKQFILNGIPTDIHINSLQYLENTPANSGFLWLLRLTKGDDVYESTDGTNYTVSTRFKNRTRILNANGVWVSNLSSEQYNSSTKKYYQTIDYSSNNGVTWDTTTIYTMDKSGFEITDIQVCKVNGTTYFLGQGDTNNMAYFSTDGMNWKGYAKAVSEYRYNKIKAVGDGIFIFNVSSQLVQLSLSNNILTVTNVLGQSNNKNTNLDNFNYLNSHYLFSDYNSDASWNIYDFGTELNNTLKFSTATTYQSHGNMPALSYCINGTYLSYDKQPGEWNSRVLYTDELKNTSYSQLLNDRYFKNYGLVGIADTNFKIRLYRYKSPHNISRDETSSNFYSKYGEKPTIYITAIPAAVRFDLVVNEYAEV